MNERIRLLAASHFPRDSEGNICATPEIITEFAELIVRETIKQMATQMYKFGDDQSNNPDWYKSEEAVKKHFGVEE